MPPQSMQMSVASVLMVVKLSQNVARGMPGEQNLHLSNFPQSRGSGGPRAGGNRAAEGGANHLFRAAAQQWYMRGSATEIEKMSSTAVFVALAHADNGDVVLPLRWCWRRAENLKALALASNGGQLDPRVAGAGSGMGTIRR